MYGPLRPILFLAMCERLESFGIIDCGENVEAGFGCRVLRQMRMGLGTSDYLNFPYDGDGVIVPEPMLAGVLDHFGIRYDEFMDGCREGSSSEASPEAEDESDSF